MVPRFVRQGQTTIPGLRLPTREQADYAFDYSCTPCVRPTNQHKRLKAEGVWRTGNTLSEGRMFLFHFSHLLIQHRLDTFHDLRS
jgi:hypothetical protein